MKIEYLCHSCLHIDTGDTTLIMDPWFKGSCYINQWHLFPQPSDLSCVSRVKNILYSHGHEDHLHSESLKAMPCEARVFYPYQWRKGVVDFFHQHNFKNVTEAVSFKEYKISPTTKIIYLGFGLESVIVVEINNIVIVNLNDALNSHHQNVVNVFLSEIKKRWHHIDYLFSGWSGAGYFPNTVHYKDKDDEEIGRIREQYFANHFCKIIKELQPVAAIPFAPGFALLEKDKRWINDVKFPREMLSSYYKEHFEKNTSVQFHIIYPGDYFDENGFHKVSRYYDQMIDGSINYLIEKVFEKEIKEAEKPRQAHVSKIPILLKKMEATVNSNLNLYDKVVLNDANFAVKLKDFKHDEFFEFNFGGENFSVKNTKALSEKIKIVITTRSDLLEYAMDNLWGGDVLTIGYGLDVDVFDEPTLEKNLDIVCVRLLTRYPTTTDSLRKDPFRTLNYFFKHPMMSRLAIKQKLTMRNAVNKFPYNERDHWISYNKCELCKVCNLPELNFDFVEGLTV
ncbi:MAG: MBL fold metallo-hydrolase [Bacteroidia bacterium]